MTKSSSLVAELKLPLSFLLAAGQRLNLQPVCASNIAQTLAGTQVHSTYLSSSGRSLLTLPMLSLTPASTTDQCSSKGGREMSAGDIGVSGPDPQAPQDFHTPEEVIVWDFPGSPQRTPIFRLLCFLLSLTLFPQFLFPSLPTTVSSSIPPGSSFFAEGSCFLSL